MMEKNGPWILIIKGMHEQGLAVLQERWKKKREASQIMELGVAYLWLKRYRDAERHFAAAISESKWSYADYYGMMGVSCWCMNEKRDAVAIWSEGLGAQYADAAGGIRIPLLLRAASTIDPDVFSLQRAHELLADKVMNPSNKYWPGAIGRYVIGNISDVALLAESMLASEEEQEVNAWQAKFYIGLMCLQNGNRSKCMDAWTDLIKIVNASDNNINFMLSCAWLEELYIIKHEISIVK